MGCVEFQWFAGELKLFSFFIIILLSIRAGDLFSSQLAAAPLLAPTSPLIMHPYKSNWSILRCTPYESVQVHTFDSQHAAELACKTLIRMSSPDRAYWYGVAELIEIL